MMYINPFFLDLAGDGCHKMFPKLYVSHKIAFDGITQLYTVQVILNKKFYPLGMFLLQTAVYDVMQAVFKIVNGWLGTETTVLSFMADFDQASRKAIRTTWQNAKLLGCAIHFIRAVGLYCIQKNIYSNAFEAASRHIASKAF